MVIKWVGFDIGLRNFSFCEISWQNERWYIHRWELIDIVQWANYKNIKQITISDLHIIIRTLLQTLYPKPLNIHHVGIETQSFGKKNILLASLVYEYFYSIWFNHQPKDQLKSVCFIPGTAKYRKEWLRTYQCKTEKKYTLRKKLSKILAVNLLKTYKFSYIQQPNILLTSLNNNIIKQDDLADSFLIAFTYVYDMKEYYNVKRASSTLDNDSGTDSVTPLNNPGSVGYTPETTLGCKRGEAGEAGETGTSENTILEAKKCSS